MYVSSIHAHSLYRRCLTRLHSAHRQNCRVFISFFQVFWWFLANLGRFLERMGQKFIFLCQRKFFCLFPLNSLKSRQSRAKRAGGHQSVRPVWFLRGRRTAARSYAEWLSFARWVCIQRRSRWSGLRSGLFRVSKSAQ
jgi:hypothetical protein